MVGGTAFDKPLVVGMREWSDSPKSGQRLHKDRSLSCRLCVTSEDKQLWAGTGLFRTTAEAEHCHDRACFPVPPTLLTCNDQILAYGATGYYPSGVPTFLSLALDEEC